MQSLPFILLQLFKCNYYLFIYTLEDKKKRRWLRKAGHGDTRPPDMSRSSFQCLFYDNDRMTVQYIFPNVSFLAQIAVWPRSTSDLWGDDSVVRKSLWNVRFCSWWRLFMSNINRPAVHPALLSCTLKQRDRESGLFIYSFIYASSIHVTTSCWRAHSLISIDTAWLEFTGQTHPPTHRRKQVHEMRNQLWATTIEFALMRKRTDTELMVPVMLDLTLKGRANIVS